MESELLQVGPCLGEVPSISNGDNDGFRVCLITALTIADFLDFKATMKARQDVGAQLGIFTLAALLRERGLTPHVINLDEWFMEFLRCREGGVRAPDGQDVSSDREPAPSSFLSFVLGRIGNAPMDVCGLSSICSSYPLTLRIAREIKRLRPEASILLGGPQASVVDVATMAAFPCIDAIVRGEADESLPTVLERLRKKLSLDGIAGVTFRKQGEVVRNPNAPVIRNLDQLPLPAFDLDPQLKDRGGIHLEIGRGCPFACTFCSTNDFFRRNFRLKSTRKILEEMKHIKAEYGISYFSMVHDMYTVDRKRVVEFCDALRECGEEFTWGCSARTDCIDDELIAIMARAGCRGIFFGIETGSPRLQVEINKNLDLVEARARIRSADEQGIQTAVALITGFPGETRDDLRDTIHFFVDSLRYDHAEPQLSLLAPLAATPIYEEHKRRLTFDEIYSDMSHQGWHQDREDVQLIRDYPEIFPNFYAVPTRWLERTYFKEVHDFVTYLASWFRWLPVAILQDSGDLLEVFDRWAQWLAARRAMGIPVDTGVAPYYTHRQFRQEFLQFVRTCYCQEMAAAPAAIAALAVSEGWCYSNQTQYSYEAVEESSELKPDAYPYPAPKTVAVDVEVDYKELIHALRHGRDLRQTPRQGATLVFRPDEADNLLVWQLAPLSAALLHRCSGSRTVEEIMIDFSKAQPEVDGIPSTKVAIFGLWLLRKQGAIGLSHRPVPVVDRTEEPDVEAFVPPPQMSGNQQPWPPRRMAAST